MTKEELRKVLNGEGSKSSKMITFYNQGMEIGEIAKLMGVRYNFVYNVVSNDCRKAGTDVRVTKKNGTVKQGIIELINANKSNTEIAKELAINYNYVFKVRKEYGIECSNQLNKIQ